MGGPKVVQWSRFSDAYQKLFGLQGATALNVVDDVFLTLPAERENRILDPARGWVRFHASSSSAASVGNFSNISLTPVDLNTIYIIEKVIFGSVTGGAILMGFRRSGPTAPGSCQAIDARQDLGSNDPTGTTGRGPRIGQATSAATVLFPNPFKVTVPANGSLLVQDVDVVVGPVAFGAQVGAVWALTFEGGAVNQEINVAFIGSQRALTDQERQG